ncbi:MAG: DEAD/DEAH box helicase, partial [Minisyncoccales bacterium]
MILDWPLEKLNFFTLREKNRLDKLGLKTIKDLVYYFPHRYEDFSKVLPISHLFDEEKATIRAWLTKVSTKVNKKGTIFLIEGIFQDHSGKIKAIWYNQPYLYQTLKKGSFYSLAGKIVKKDEEIFFSNPSFEPILPKEPSSLCLHTARLVPIYPEIKGIRSKWIRKTIFNFLNKFKEKLEEFLTPSILKKEQFPPFSEAVWQMHFPDSLSKNDEAKKRFEFEEIFLFQLKIFQAKLRFKQKKAFPLRLHLEEIQKFLKTLPFQLTRAQKKAVWEILKDMEKPYPMNRLLQGDVGSGKTMVALIAAFNTVINGFQVVFLAPTEILAKQHYRVFKNFLRDFPFKISLLSSGQKDDLNDIKDGNFDIVIGTHALLQEKFNFEKLAFVILDEQHRFGVEQRQKFSLKKEFVPHFLSMSATPIPRTLALT